MKKRGPTSRSDSVPKVDETTIAKLFEEVKAMFRTLPDNVEEKTGRSIRRGALRKERMFHPMMFEELLFRPIEDKEEHQGVGWLVFISMFRDDLPWFYELGYEVYRAIESRNVELMVASARKMRRTIDFIMHSRIGDMLMRTEDKDSLRVLRHLPEMTEHYLNRLENIRIPQRPRTIRRAGKIG